MFGFSKMFPTYKSFEEHIEENCPWYRDREKYDRLLSAQWEKVKHIMETKAAALPEPDESGNYPPGWYYNFGGKNRSYIGCPFHKDSVNGQRLLSRDLYWDGKGAHPIWGVMDSLIARNSPASTNGQSVPKRTP